MSGIIQPIRLPRYSYLPGTQVKIKYVNNEFPLILTLPGEIVGRMISTPEIDWWLVKSPTTYTAGPLRNKYQAVLIIPHTDLSLDCMKN